jgi:uncharacterized protein (TIGR02001 family)
LITIDTGVVARLLATISGITALGLSHPVHASEEGDASLALSGSASIVSDYRFRGLSFSGGSPAIQAEIELEHESGLYGGVWATSAEDGGSGLGSVEVDFYGGWSGEVAPSLVTDVNLIYYFYPDAINEPGFASNSFEANLSASYEIGAFEPTIGYSYAWAQKALGGESSSYLYMDARLAIPATPITANMHVGYTDGSYSISDDGNNVDWSIGATVEILPNLTAGAEYIGIDGPHIRNFSDDTIVFKLVASF